MFFVDVDIMTTDQLKEVLGNYKWTLLVALIMFAMVGFGYKLARIIDEGDSKKVQAQQETIAILSEENHALTTKPYHLNRERPKVRGRLRARPGAARSSYRKPFILVFRKLLFVYRNSA